MLGSNRRRCLSKTVALTVFLLVTALAVSGCVRVHADLTLSSQDMVSGTLVVAALPSSPTDKGPALTVPDSLSNRVTSTAYRAGGYVGTQLNIRSLTFTEFGELVAAASQNTQAHYQLAIRRSGALVSVAGSADLTQIPQTQADVRIQVSFAGPVTQTDGSTGANNTVTWTVPGGQDTTFSATAQYAESGATHTWWFWVLMLGLAGLVAAWFVTMLALWARRRNIRKEQAMAVY